MSWSRLASPAFLVVVAVLALSAFGLRSAISAMGAHLQKKDLPPPNGLRFDSLPREFGGWEWVPSVADERLSAEVEKTLGTTNYVSRRFAKEVGGEREMMELHLAYYTGMVDTVPHVPERCFVGGGMRIGSAPRVVPVPLDMSNFSLDPTVDRGVHGEIYEGRDQRRLPVRMPRGIDALKMNVSEFRDSDTDIGVFAGYFFIANGGLAPRAEDVRFLAFNLTDDYAYYAKVQFTSQSVDSAEELAALAADFLDAALPEIMRRLPDWVEVKEGRYPPEQSSDGADASAERS